MFSWQRNVATLSLFFSSIIACQLSSASTPSQEKLTPVEQSYIKFDRLVRDNSGKADEARQASEVYQSVFSVYQSPWKLRSLTLRDVQAVFMAADTVDFYDPSDRHITDMRLDYAELSRRGAATLDQTSAFYGALFQARKFEEMTAFYTQHKSAQLPKPPLYFAKADVGQRHVVLDVSSTSNTLTVRGDDIDHGSKILVISHPLCHFSQNAMRAIEANAELRRVFDQNSVWVSPPDRNLDLGPFQEWKKNHREAPISIALNQASWPEVQIWQTPTFIFLREGKVVGEVIGWPVEGNVKALDEEIAKIGL
ncbi:MAG TPA: hypothetical protein VL997_00090 [Dyella sp.]|nr:hypothetical protein [Dyella sp.]